MVFELPFLRIRVSVEYRGAGQKAAGQDAPSGFYPLSAVEEARRRRRQRRLERLERQVAEIEAYSALPGC